MPLSVRVCLCVARSATFNLHHWLFYSATLKQVLSHCLTLSLSLSLFFSPSLSLCCYLSVVNFMRIFSFACLSGRLYRNLLCLFNWIRIADAGDNFATECAAASAQITPSGAEREERRGERVQRVDWVRMSLIASVVDQLDDLV